MKSFARNLAASYLAFCCRLVLRRCRAKIIGVTGSYGKTSTKDAIAFLLSRKYRVYASKKSLNTEFGFALAILDLPSGFSNPFSWLWILLRATMQAITKTGKARLGYDYLILEYGADKPGDIEYLISLARPNIGVLTTVAPVHLDQKQFPSIKAILEEKKKLLACLEQNDVAIYNGDHSLLQNLKNELHCRAKTFGEKPENDLFASSIISGHSNLSATITYNLQPITYNLITKVLGKHHIGIFLAALLVGETCGISIKEGVEILKDFSLAPGRMSKLEGINGCTLLDSSYNASPETMEAALKLLEEFPAKRRIAILGSMNELGAQSERSHRRIGKKVSQSCDYLMTVGKEAQWIAQEAIDRGMEISRIQSFADAEKVGEALRSFVEEGDCLLFKGSQNRVRLERAIKKLLKDPAQASHLLVRQEKEWQGKTTQSGVLPF